MNISFKQANAANFAHTRTSSIKYLVIHFTANNGDTAKNNADYFARESPKASAHYFVDEGDIVWQSVKDTDTAWHCGIGTSGVYTYKHKECRNANSIGIELCSRMNAAGYYFKQETVANAVELTKELMQKYNIPIENVIRHYDVTGKVCPAPFVNDVKQWEKFKDCLIMKEDIVMEKRYNTIAELPDWAKPTIQKLVDKGYLSGDGNGLDLSHDMVRIFAVNDRAGMYK